MSDKGRSDRRLFGGYDHYDEHGHKTGYSEPGLLGGYNHYDSRGHKTGHSDPGIISGYNHYDAHGHKTGHSEPGLFGGIDHYDSNGKKIGHSEKGFAGGYYHSSDGCYVATCVCGSYDCPEVWTLRRFRDIVLKNSRAGRLFIRVYYAVSPRIVARCGHRARFTRFWRRRLDKLTAYLRKKGFADTPYADARQTREE